MNFVASGMLVLLLVAALAALSSADPLENMPRRYDYHQSFKKPYYWLKDNNTVPYFEILGDVFYAPDFIRLTSSVPNQASAIWSKEPNHFKEWQVLLCVQVFGRGYMGGDGIALWYSKEHMTPGPVYGSKDAWTGLGVLFDTADSRSNRHNPYVYAVLNDGTREIAQRTDYGAFSLGGCFRDYRNAPSTTWVRVTYAARRLTVDVDMRGHGKAYSNCMMKEEVDIPVGYYFGMSGSTGTHFADDQDILSFEVFEVNPPPKVQKQKEDSKHKGEEFHIDDETKKKIEEVEHNVEEVLKVVASDDEVAEEDDNMQGDNWNGHSLAVVQDNQQAIMEALHVILEKLGDGSSSPPAHPDPVSGSSAYGGIDSARLEELTRQFGLLASDVRDLATVVRETLHKVSASGSDDIDQKMQRIEGHLSTLHGKVDSANTAASQAAYAATQSSKTSTTHYVLYGVALTFGALLMYGWLRVKGDNRSKKFI